MILAPASEEEDIFVTGRPVSVPSNGSVARVCFSLKSKRRIRERLSAGDIHLIHVHEPLIPSSGLLALAEAVQPIVATFHASRPRSLGYLIGKPLLTRYARRIRTPIAVSLAAQDLVSRYFPDDYTILPNGVDLAVFSSPEPDPEVNALRPYVLFVGRSEPRKGFRVAAKAMEIVQSEHPDVKLVAVGPTGKDVAAARTRAEIMTLGSVPRTRLPALYAGASVFVAPSLSGESFGIVLIEAMAAGTPVVCSDLPGYLEAAAGAAIGVPAGNPDRTASAIISLLEDPSLAFDVARRGTTRARELDWAVLVEKVLSVYWTAVS